MGIEVTHNTKHQCKIKIKRAIGYYKGDKL
jgi:hypothetical protein